MPACQLGGGGQRRAADRVGHRRGPRLEVTDVDLAAGAGEPDGAVAANFTVAGVDLGETKPGVGSPESASGVEALLPMPRRANASQSAAWLAPPKRIRSAASIASRASSMLVAPCWSRKASKTSCSQRRLPGHWVAGVGVLVAVAWAQRRLQRLVGRGVGRVVLRDQGLADLPHGAVPDLAVGVDLGPGGVEAVVAVVQRVGVDGVVADADGLVAGGVGPDGPRVGARWSSRARTCTRRRSGHPRTRPWRRPARR